MTLENLKLYLRTGETGTIGCRLMVQTPQAALKPQGQSVKMDRRMPLAAQVLQARLVVQKPLMRPMVQEPRIAQVRLLVQQPPAGQGDFA
jgi:hypothetical protein